MGATLLVLMIYWSIMKVFIFVNLQFLGFWLIWSLIPIQHYNSVILNMFFYFNGKFEFYFKHAYSPPLDHIKVLS